LNDPPPLVPWSLDSRIVAPVCPACSACGADLTRATWTRRGEVTERTTCVCGVESMQALLRPVRTREGWRALGKSPEAQAQELMRCRRSPWYWLSNYVYTEDAHWVSKGWTSANRRLPSVPYLRSVVYWLWHEWFTAWPKSRQMMLTWVVVCYILGEALLLGGRLYMLQSKREEDAAAMLWRANGVYTRMQDFAPWYGAKRIGPGAATRLEFSNGSVIVAAPQGAHMVQSHTPAWLVCDEAQLQDEIEGAYHQALPAVERITLIGSADFGWFWQTFLPDKLGKEK